MFTSYLRDAAIYTTVKLILFQENHRITLFKDVVMAK